MKGGVQLGSSAYLGTMAAPPKRSGSGSSVMDLWELDWSPLKAELPISASLNVLWLVPLPPHPAVFIVLTLCSGVSVFAPPTLMALPPAYFSEVVIFGDSPV